ncbi:MAG: hypothetical protein NXH85_00700 [Pseudomonadaceae bacterium]|nr:hypothetical protein [Pseudomonadaceae bacterium]
MRYVQTYPRQFLAGISLLALSLVTPTASAEYFVVVGSFLDSDVAVAELHRRSDRSGNTLRIAVTDVGEQTYHRLISGPFVNPRTALSEQMNWQSVGVTDAWVVQLRGVPERRRPALTQGLDIAKQ